MAVKLYTFNPPIPLTDKSSFDVGAAVTFRKRTLDDLPPNHYRLLQFEGYALANKVELKTSVRDGVHSMSQTVGELTVSKEGYTGSIEQVGTRTEVEQPTIKSIDELSPDTVVYVRQPSETEGKVYFIIRFEGSDPNDHSSTPIETQWMNVAE